ncbi:MAG TPA: tetratricopeptide repeat protein [Gemmatimonadaceae bacterium]|nr:tetratricopeptide repeat protein [Gemmatimonadaceae bacterium]
MNRQALASLDAARPAIARLDRSRHSEELAADIMEAWTAVETAMRAMLGGTPLSGQALIREARNRHMISLDQANALAEFHAARDRSQSTTYHPSDADINAAREGFLKLEASLMTPEPTDPPVVPPGEAMSTKGLRLSPLGTPQPVPMPREGRPWWFWVVPAVVLIAIGVGAWALFGRGGDATIRRGVDYWQHGQRELAIGEFTRASRDDPKSALPHVYLSRMAREVGNMTLATQEATTALQAEPTSGTALREMGAVMLAAGNYEVARRFYVRALQADPQDRTSQGFLGCTLVKLGRIDEGMKWMNRAGQGSWSGCAPPMIPPGATAPSTLPAIPR